MSIQLSIIIPVYNAGNLISRCIKSLKFKCNYEIIVVNDGSTDDTRIHLDKEQRLNKNLKIIEQENQGVSASRNIGLRQASGEYVIFLDADDYLEKSYELEDKIFFSVEKKYDIYVWGYYLETNTTVEKVAFKKNQAIATTQNLNYFMSNFFIDKKYRSAVWNKAYRRDKIDKLSFISYKEVLSEDSLFNLQSVFLNNDLSILILNEVYTMHTYEEESLSNSKIQNEIVSRVKTSLYNIFDSIDNDATMETSWLYPYYLIDYLLKLSILSVLINKNSFSLFKRELNDVISISLFKKNNTSNLIKWLKISNNKKKTVYHIFLALLIKLKLRTMLASFLWLRYKWIY